MPTFDADERLSEHFVRREFMCKCGCALCKPHPALFPALELLRHHIGDRPIIINSGHRCAAHNKEVGGSRNSQHLHGRAADIRCPGRTSEELFIAALHVPQFRLSGIGVYKTFLHVDVRGYKSRWQDSASTPLDHRLAALEQRIVAEIGKERA